MERGRTTTTTRAERQAAARRLWSDAGAIKTERVRLDFIRIIKTSVRRETRVVIGEIFVMRDCTSSYRRARAMTSIAFSIPRAHGCMKFRPRARTIWPLVVLRSEVST